MKQIWRQYNEYFIALFALLVFATFDMWVKPLFLLFYPGADSVIIESYSFGVLQRLAFALLVIGFVGAVGWTWHKWTFPKINEYLDDYFGQYSDRANMAKSMLAFVTYAFYVIICTIITVAIIS